MAIQVQGNGGTVGEIDSSHRALRASLRPMEVVGSYRLGARSLEIAAGAGAAAEVFAFLNPSALNTALVRRVSISVNTIATGFTAGVGLFTMKVARTFTAAPTAGTTITLTGNNCKLRTDHATPSCAAYIADASVLTSGTETADSTSVGEVVGTFSTAVQTVLIDRAVIFDRSQPGDYPLVLEQNEGFIIYATVPATGTWFLTVNMEWDEVLNATFAG